MTTDEAGRAKEFAVRVDDDSVCFHVLIIPYPGGVSTEKNAHLNNNLNSMLVPRNEVESKEKCGTLHGSPVYMIRCIGGLFLCAVSKGGSFESIGLGPLPIVAKKIAERAEPDILWNIAKSEELELRFYQDLLPEWEEATEQLREYQRGGV